MMKTHHDESCLVFAINESPTQLKYFTRILEDEGLTVQAFSDAEEALEVMNSGVRPDLVITDLQMAGIDGWSFCRLLRSPDYPYFNQVPILVVSETFSGNDPERITAESGADAFLPSSVKRVILIGQVKKLLAGEKSQGLPKVLIIEGSKSLSTRLSKAFLSHNYRIFSAENGREAFKLYRETHPGVVILDQKLTGNKGDRLLKRLHDHDPDCAIIVINSDSRRGNAFRVMKSGARAYVRDPFDPEYIIHLCEQTHRELMLLHSERRIREYTTELQKSRTRYRQLIDQAMDGIFELNDDTGFVLVNAKLCEMLGYTEEELLQMSVLDTYPDEIRHHCLQRLARIRAGESLRFERPMKRKDGSIFYGEISATRLKDGSQQAIVHDITLRRQSETKLRESEERYRSILDNMEEIYYESDLQGYFTFFNASTLKKLELSREEFVGSNFRDYTDEVTAQRIRAAYHEVYLTGETIKGFEFELLNKRGERIPMETSVALNRDGNGNTVGFKGIIRDITERKNIERYIIGLNNLKEQLLGKISLTEKLSLITDGIVRIFKADFARIWTIREGDLCRKPGGCLHLNVCTNRKSCLHLVASSGRYTHLEGSHARVPLGSYKIGMVASGEASCFITNDVAHDPQVPDHEWAGSLGLVSFAGCRLISADGNPIGVLAFFRKSPIIRDEEKLLEDLANTTSQVILTGMAEEARLESDKQYRLLIENANEAIFVAQDGMLRFVNPKTEKVLGYSKDELTTTPFKNFIHPEDREMVISTNQRRMEGKVPPGIYSFRTVSKEGKVVWLELSVVLITWEGRPAALCFGEDITERTRAEEEKQRLQAQLVQAQKMESIGTLAGGIAHDFNNILSGIMGFTELAIREEGDPEKIKKMLKEVLKASNRARDLVKQILTFSRKAETASSPVVFGDVVRESLRMLRSLIPSTIEIRMDLMDTGLIMADPTKIHQIMMNLTTNAAHAMEDNGGVLEISLRTAFIGEVEAEGLDIAAGSYLKLTVRDTGHGMTPEIMERIFDPYFTTKEVGRGTGLGLAVVHGIVKSHKGSVICTSIPEKGTTFDIYLPEIDGDLSDADRQAGKSLPNGNENILFIDDEPMIVELAKDMLSTLGYGVVAKTDSMEALHYFQNNHHKLDLIITDMTMPGMTGDRLAQTFMEIRRDIPVILCSGYSEHITEDEAKKIGIRAFVMKPLGMRMLAETIRKVIEEKDI